MINQKELIERQLNINRLCKITIEEARRRLTELEEIFIKQTKDLMFLYVNELEKIKKERKKEIGK